MIPKELLGKIVTVSTVQINFRFKEEAMMNYFTGYLESVSEAGIVLAHHVTKCKSYIFMPHIVAISEEQVLYESDPEDAKIIEEYRKEKPETARRTAIPPKGSFMNPAALEEIANKAKSQLAAKP